MMKLLIIAVFLYLAFCNLSTSVSIDCEYGVYKFDNLGKIYHCDVNNSPIILNKESTEVNVITGAHKDSKNDSDVALFYTYEKTMKYFPQGLEKFYENLRGIYISGCELKEIHQSDLKPFPDLEFLTVKYNEIEVLEEGLFNFNPKLKTIELYEEHIIHIDSNVFDELPNLVNFGFYRVPCIGRDVDDDRADVEKAIESAKIKCVSSDFKALAEEFKALETELSQENSEKAIEKFKNFENFFKKSKFVEFRPLRYKVADLKLKYNLTSEDSSQNISEKLSALPDIPSILSDIKSSQDALKSSLDAVKSSQDNLQSSIGEKFEKELSKAKIEMVANFDKKLKEVEEELVKKFEEILVEKLRKFLS